MNSAQTHWKALKRASQWKKKAWNAERGLHYSRGSHLWKRQTPKRKNRNTIQMGIKSVFKYSLFC